MRATRLACCLLTVTLVGCDQSPTAPDDLLRSEANVDSLTISGQVYANLGPVYPAIGNAVVVVDAADGSQVTGVSDAEGFYRLSVSRGSVTIRASKDGYDAKQSHFDLSSDTILNFSLSRR